MFHRVITNWLMKMETLSHAKTKEKVNNISEESEQ